MTLVLAFSHRDAEAALRLIRWIAFLRTKRPGVFRRLFVVPSNVVSGMRRSIEILDLACRTFHKVSWLQGVHLPEKGWPASPNAMFKAAIEHAHDDILWLEPDAIPVKEDWEDVLHDEFDECGQPFMGCHVHDFNIHMSGVGFYSAKWRDYAPTLVCAPDTMGWDLYSAAEVIRNCHFTRHIQHVFYKPEIHNLTILHGDTRLFHQDKVGALVRLMDRERYQGVVATSPEFSYHLPDLPQLMRKFYRAENTNRPIKAPGFEFRFENYKMVGGTWNGIYTTDDEAQISALDQMASNQSKPVYAIDREEYERLAKKKAPLDPPIGTSAPSNPLQASINGKAAVLVENPASLDRTSLDSNAPNVVEDVASVLKIGSVSMADHPGANTRKPTGTKRKATK